MNTQNSIIIIIIIIVLIILSCKLYELYKNRYNCNNDKNNNKIVEYDDQYLVNLDVRPDRLSHSRCRLNKQEFYPTRFPAVNGKLLSNDEIINIVDSSAMESVINGYRTRHYELSLGAIGCYLSHVNIWKKLLDENQKQQRLYIFEDDTVPTFSKTQVDEYIKELPSDWDILLFGGIYHKSIPVSKNIAKIHEFYCLHGYVVNNKNIHTLLNNAFPISKQIDHWLSDLCKKNMINIYGVTTNQWHQTNQDTNIQTPMKMFNAYI